MLDLRTGKEMTRRETIKGGLGLAAILAAGKAPAMLLGARGVTFGGGLSARSYIQLGLCHQWDGIENNGYGIHSDVITSWKGLTDIGYNLDISGSTIENKSVVVPAGKLYNAVSYPLVPNYVGSMPVTIEYVWQYINRLRVKDSPKLAPEQDYLDVMNASFSEFYPYKQKYDVIIVPTMISNTEKRWQTYSLTLDESNTLGTFSWVNHAAGVNTSEVYYNADVRNTTGFIASASNFTPRLRNTMSFSIGSSEGYTARTFPCRYCSIRIYNRALTASEIAANHAIDKARFGI